MGKIFLFAKSSEFKYKTHKNPFYLRSDVQQCLKMLESYYHT